MKMSIFTVQDHFVQSKDETIISYKCLGEGPGLLIVHGGFRASQHYMKLAEFLANHFTVYVMDRRGRNNSGPKGELYSMEKECEDIEAIIIKHSIPFVFGHSFGAVSTLNASVKLSIQKIAVYEPPIVKYFPIDWLPQFENELGKGDAISASVTFLKGMQMGGVIGNLPRFLLKIFFKMMAKGDDWDENVELLKTFPIEARVVLELENELENYYKITVPALVMYGTRTTDYLINAVKEISKIIPNATLIELEGLIHNAPDEQNPEMVGKELIKYFLK